MISLAAEAVEKGIRKHFNLPIGFSSLF